MKLSLALSTVIIGNTVCGTIANGLRETVDPFLTNEDDCGHVSIERSLQFEVFEKNYTLGRHDCLFNFTGPLVSVDEIVCTQELDAPNSATVTATLSGGNCTNMLLSPPDFLSATASRPSDASAVSLIQFSTIPVPAVQGDVSLTEFCLTTILKEDGFEMFYIKAPISVEFQYDGTFKIVVDTSLTDTIVEAVENAINFTPVAYRCNPDFTTTDAPLPLGGVLYVCIVPNPEYQDVKIDQATSFDVIQPVLAVTSDLGSSPVQAPNSNPTLQVYYKITSGTCSSNGYMNIFGTSNCVEAIEGLGSSYVTQYNGITSIVDGCSLKDGDMYINSGSTCLAQARDPQRCGPNYGGDICSLNKCCSKHNWCGQKSRGWCGRGCQPEYGFCDNVESSATPVSCKCSQLNPCFCKRHLIIANLIKDGNPNPTTVVVPGVVDEAPSETVSLSQVQRGIIIGTRMPSRFFDNPTEVTGSGEVTFASADRRLHSKINFSRNLQEASNDSAKFGLQIGLTRREINSGTTLTSAFFDMTRSIIFIILFTLYYFD